MGQDVNSRFALTLAQRRASLAGCGLVLLLGAAMLLSFPPERYGFYPVCPIHAWTGLLCPGCGGTRAMAALLRGHVAEAWQWNALVVGLVPLCLIYAGMMARRWWRGGMGWVEVPAGVWVGIGMVAGVFGVMRNLG